MDPQVETAETWMLPLQDPELWESIHAVIKSSVAAMPASARRLELGKSDMAILEMLMERPHSPSELAKALQVTNAAVTIAVDRLEKRGHVTRSRDEDDGRRVLVRISTMAEHEVGAELAPLFQKLHALVSETPEKDRETISNFLKKLDSILNQHSLGAKER